MAKPRIEQPIDVRVRLPGAAVAAAHELATVQARSLSDVLRLAVLAGLPAVQDLTAAPIFDVDSGVN